MHRLKTLALFLVVSWLATPTRGASQATADEPVTTIERIERVDATSDAWAADAESHDGPRRLETNEVVSSPSSAPPATASAAPNCPGTDLPRGEAELERGIAALRDALQLEPNPESVPVPAPEVLALYQSALAHFDLACEWLGPRALERRAIALNLLGRNYEAHVNLLEFIRRVPVEEIDERTRARVEGNRPRYERLLVGLRVQSSPSGARVEILDRPDLSLRTPTELVFLPPRDTPYEIRVSLEGYVSVRRSVNGAIGARPELELALMPASTPVEPTPVPVPESTSRRGRWSSALVASGATAAVTLVGAIIAHGISEERARAFNRGCYPVQVEGCNAVRREHERAFGVAVGGYILSGLAAITMASFGLLEWRQRRASGERRAVACTVSGGLGVGCRVDF